MRQLVNSYPEEAKSIYEKVNAFAENVKQLAKRHINKPFVHEDGSAGDDSTQVAVTDATFTTSSRKLPSDYDFNNAMRSARANDIILYERTAIEPDLLVRREHDILETSGDQIRWSEQDSLDTTSMYQQLPFLASETPPRSDLNTFAEEIAVDPADLSQRDSPDLCSTSRALQEHTSEDPCHISRDVVRGSKRRASDVKIQPRAKRSRKSAANNASAVGVFEPHITQDQRNLAAQQSAVLRTSRFILPRSSFSVQVSQIKDLFEDRLGYQERPYASLLTALLFAIAGPASFVQLRDVTRAIKSRECFQASQSSLTIADVLKRLDGLENTISAGFLLRRFYLLRLFRQRASLKEAIQAKRLRLRSGRRTGGDSGRIASLVLTKMIKEAYPSSDASPGDRSDLKTERKSLQNKLQAATHWHALQEEFSVGIIALVPVGREFHMQDQRSVVQIAA
jgi:hypothetical protein